MHRIISLIFASAAATLASTAAQSPVNSALPAAPYEAPPVLKASDIWEGNLLEGPNHKVREDVTTTGFTNTYVIDSDFGVFYVNGDNLLLERVREIYAIAGIQQTKETTAYAEAIGSGISGTLEGAESLIKDPAGSIVGIGKGAARFLRSAGERVKITAEGNDAAAKLDQYTEAKRQIAAKYRVDPYTSNQVYQHEVDSVATAATMGNLTFKVASYAIPGGGGIALRGLGTTEELNDKLVETGPYDLRVQNKNLLHAMSISDADIEAFLDNQSLTPRHRTAIAMALDALGATRNRGEYLRLACTAASEEDAFFFSNNAALLAAYNARRSKITTIVDCNGMPAGITVDNRLVLPIHLDYGSWNQLSDRFLQAFIAYTGNGLTIDSRELVITGVLTPLAKQQADARGVIVTEKAYEVFAN